MTLLAVVEVADPAQATGGVVGLIGPRAVGMIDLGDAAGGAGIAWVSNLVLSITLSSPQNPSHNNHTH